MDKLKVCAVAFSKLFNVKYHCILGRKGITREFTLAFSPYEFHHLCGLIKLSDMPILRGNRERVFKNICSGKITYEMISKSNDFNQISDRLAFLSGLEDFMDSNSIVFSYDKRNSKSSRIDAKYLLQNTIDDAVVYFFIGNQKDDDTLIGISFFLKGLQDYTVAQQRWTLLYKEKISCDTGNAVVQYDRLSKQNPKRIWD